MLERRGALAVCGVAAAAVLVVTVLSTSGATERRMAGQAGALSLASGAAWYSETIDSSAPTLLRDRTRGPEVLRKWLTSSGYRFERVSIRGLRRFPGSYAIGDSEPGFGDWDALDVHSLPATAPGVLRLLRSGRLEQGQSDPAERGSPLIWLAQLSAMLADDPTTPAIRQAAFAAIARFPGLEHLGRVRDPRGRPGIAVAETAGNLHPVAVATGPGCTNPAGGSGCTSVAEPSGTYRTELVFDPATDRPLGLVTTAVRAIPAADIVAGTAVYAVSYVQGRVVANPHLPPPPQPPHRTVQSVPWHLRQARGRTLKVSWQSGTCDP
ncbi:MAG TPA: hypothetical protein VE127_07160, partial [Solirubrobacteraceae bacterium]|nr:hypothetical protein [Solirubrobacteraceae bacterium]